MADDPQKAKANTSVAKADARGTQSNPDADVTPEEVRYSEEELRENAGPLLGVSPHAVAGALYDSGRKTHTLEEAQTLVNDFLKREVQ